MLCLFPKKCGKGLDKTPTLMYNKSKTKNIKQRSLIHMDNNNEREFFTLTDEEGNETRTVDVTLKAKHNYQYYEQWKSHQHDFCSVF